MLTFAALRDANDRRNAAVFQNDGWGETDWGCALAGEVGELCNILKKRRRHGDDRAHLFEEAAKEIADVQIYLDLLARHMGVNLADATVRKFNEVSERRGSDIRL